MTDVPWAARTQLALSCLASGEATSALGTPGRLALPAGGWGCRGGRAQSPSSGSSVWVTGGKGIQGRGASGLDSGRAFSRDVTARLGSNSCDCFENGVRTWHLSRYLLHSLLPPPLWTKPQRAQHLDVVSWKRPLGQRTSV